MHGLSLVVLTVLLLGGLAYFAARSVPVRCLCRNNITVQGRRGGLEPVKERCTALCATQGGYGPLVR